MAVRLRYKMITTRNKAMVSLATISSSTLSNLMDDGKMTTANPMNSDLRPTRKWETPECWSTKSRTLGESLVSLPRSGSGTEEDCIPTKTSSSPHPGAYSNNHLMVNRELILVCIVTIISWWSIENAWCEGYSSWSEVVPWIVKQRRMLSTWPRTDVHSTGFSTGLATASRGIIIKTFGENVVWPFFSRNA